MSSRDNLIPAIGDVLMGRYRIESFIARGGMGVVMRARQLSMDREVAIKMILPQYAENEKTLARFDREVHLAKQLRHPNIVELYDYGSTKAGVLYLVMEFLEGEDLKTLLRRDGPMPVGRAGKIALQVLDALAEAHTRDIVHRDSKPSNIFVTQMRRLGDFAKLLDFGIAKSLAEDASEVTAQGEICGTSSYMAPEMFVQGTVGTTVDVYAMGLILLEMLLGKKVFAGQSSAETLVLHLRKDVTIPPPFTATHLSQVLLKSLEKHPRNRFSNAVEFLEELEPALDSLDGAMRVSPDTIATYDQDLADDPGLLDQVLAGPWASGMTEPESGSSDIVVVPGSQESRDDPPEFEAAVTQLMEKARADFVREEESVADGEPEGAREGEDGGLEVETRHHIPTPSSHQLDEFDGIEEIDPGPPLDEVEPESLEPRVVDGDGDDEDDEEETVEEPVEAPASSESTSKEMAQTIPMQTVPHTSTMTSIDRPPLWKRPGVLAAFAAACAAIFGITLAVTVLPGPEGPAETTRSSERGEAAEPAEAPPETDESPGSDDELEAGLTQPSKSTDDDNPSADGSDEPPEADGDGRADDEVQKAQQLAVESESDPEPVEVEPTEEDPPVEKPPAREPVKEVAKETTTPTEKETDSKRETAQKKKKKKKKPGREPAAPSKSNDSSKTNESSPTAPSIEVPKFD